MCTSLDYERASGLRKTAVSSHSEQWRQAISLIGQFSLCFGKRGRIPGRLPIVRLTSLPRRADFALGAG